MFLYCVYGGLASLRQILRHLTQEHSLFTPPRSLLAAPCFIRVFVMMKETIHRRVCQDEPSCSQQTGGHVGLYKHPLKIFFLHHLMEYMLRTSSHIFSIPRHLALLSSTTKWHTQTCPSPRPHPLVVGEVLGPPIMADPIGTPVLLVLPLESLRLHPHQNRNLQSLISCLHLVHLLRAMILYQSLTKAIKWMMRPGFVI